MAFKDSTTIYGDIIDLPHPESKKHPRMSMHDRAAQFSPFAALTGHDAAIKETARLTDAFVELDETAKAGLDGKLLTILEKLKEKPYVTFTYFRKDERKDGGAYKVIEGTIRKIDFYEREIVMDDHTRIRMDDVIELDSEIFCRW